MNIWTKRLLIVLEIGGGFVGLMVLAQSFAVSEITFFSAILHSVFAVLFSLGIIAGIALVEEPGLGIHLSMVYQALQIPLFGSPFITCIFTSGFMVSIGVLLKDGEFRLAANFNFGSQSQFFLFQERPWFMSINIVAVVFFVMLERSLRKMTKPENGPAPTDIEPSAAPDEPATYTAGDQS